MKIILDRFHGRRRFEHRRFRGVVRSELDWNGIIDIEATPALDDEENRVLGRGFTGERARVTSRLLSRERTTADRPSTRQVRCDAAAAPAVEDGPFDVGYGVVDDHAESVPDSKPSSKIASTNPVSTAIARTIGDSSASELVMVSRY